MKDAKYRSVKRILSNILVSLGEDQINQAFPQEELVNLDPFILLHHFDISLNPNQRGFYVPPHPHRGFCPITFVFEGAVEHKDSLGNHHVVEKDGVQWISAGKGIIHSEKSPKKLTESGGRLQGIQLWLNLASDKKMTPASYVPLDAEKIPLFNTDGVELRVVSGELSGLSGPAPSSHITAMLKIEEGFSHQLTLPTNYNSALYLLEGDVTINSNYTLEEKHIVVFENEGGLINIEARQNAKILIISGLAHNEPIVSYGPYVMNTNTEILEALRDYQMGKMGILIE